MFDHLDFMAGSSFMGLFWILLVVLLVWLAFVGLRAGGGTKDGSPSAREILDQRYARGEIDADEYQRRRADLDT